MKSDELKGGKTMKSQIPNFVSSLRVFASPFLAHAKSHEQPELAFALFVFIGLTDYLDGALAIRLNAISERGKRWVDPVCDFVAALGVIYGFTFQDDNYQQRLWIAAALVASTVLLKFAKEQWWWNWPRLKAFAYGFLPVFYCACVAVFMYMYAAAAIDPKVMWWLDWLVVPIVGILSYSKRHRFKDWFGSLEVWVKSFTTHPA